MITILASAMPESAIKVERIARSRNLSSAPPIAMTGPGAHRLRCTARCLPAFNDLDVTSIGGIYRVAKNRSNRVGLPHGVFFADHDGDFAAFTLVRDASRVFARSQLP